MISLRCRVERTLTLDQWNFSFMGIRSLCCFSDSSGEIRSALLVKLNSGVAASEAVDGIWPAIEMVNLMAKRLRGSLNLGF